MNAKIFGKMQKVLFFLFLTTVSKILILSKIYSYSKQFLRKTNVNFSFNWGCKGGGRGRREEGGRSTNIPFLRFLGRGVGEGGRGSGWGRNPINSTFSFLNPAHNPCMQKLRNNMTRTADQVTGLI
jgi:hypothetical protein